MEEIEQRVTSINSNIVLLDEYKNAKSHIKCHCNKHNIDFEVYSETLLYGKYICPLCTKEGISNSKLKTHEEFIEELHRVHSNLIPLEQYKGANHKIKMKCLKCGHERYVFPNNIFRFGDGCPKCLGIITGQEDFI